MEIFISNFLHAGGPLFIFCFLLGWSPYFSNSFAWNDAKFNDPIRQGLQSPLYSHALVAGIAAALPSCLELIFYATFSRGNAVKRTIYILANMLIFISPEFISLLLVLPTSDSKLYYILWNNRKSVSIFLAMLLLCRFNKKSWSCKLSTVIVSLIYLGSSLCTLAPFFPGSTKIWIEYLGIFFQFIGCLLFMIKSYKFFGANSATKKSDDFKILDDLLCKFVTLSILFVIIGIFGLYLGCGLPYWTQWNSTYITCSTLLFVIPNIIIGVAFAYATRNETVFLQQAKQMFVNYISHEMRTPLNTAVMGLQYLHSELVKFEANEEIMTTLDEVTNGCEISVTILTEMLDFDKLQSGLMKMELEEVSVKKFLVDTISPFYLQAGLKDILLDCNLDSPALNYLLVDLDRSKFAQVIRNLISNALKFTPTGGTVTITTTVTPFSPLLSVSNKKAAIAAIGQSAFSSSQQQQQQQLLTIEVTDTGAGISKENQKKMFKEMVQFNPGKLQSGGGSGLGLYISKGIMDLLHGTLSMYSDGEGRGCTFTITILAKYENLIDVKVSEFKVEEEEVEKEEENLRSLALGNTRPDNDNHHHHHLCRSSGSNIGNSTDNIQNNNNNYSNNNNNYNHNNNSNNINSNVSTNEHRHISHLRRADSVHSLASASSSSKVTPARLRRANSARSNATTTPPTSTPTSEKILHYSSFNSTTGTGRNTDPLPPLFKVLVVDDSTSNRKMLARLLRDKCAVIVEAEDGVQAVSRIKDVLHDAEHSHYDAILMDFMMPNMDGPEAVRRIRELGFTGMIIGITGNVLPVDKERFLSQGANVVVTKPINMRDIDAVFAKLPAPTPPATTTTTATTTATTDAITTTTSTCFPTNTITTDATTTATPLFPPAGT